MEQGAVENFLKNWQKILESSHELMSQVTAINNSIAKNIEGIMLGIERQTEPIRMFWSKNERLLEGATDSIRSISNAIGEAYKNFPIPETMAADIGRIAEGLTQQMKPLVKILREWQDITKSW